MGCPTLNLLPCHRLVKEPQWVETCGSSRLDDLFAAEGLLCSPSGFPPNELVEWVLLLNRDNLAIDIFNVFIYVINIQNNKNIGRGWREEHPLFIIG